MCRVVNREKRIFPSCASFLLDVSGIQALFAWQ
jgi:hypothetical protein